MDFSEPEVESLIRQCLREDIGEGDHSSLASVLHGTSGHSQILFKQQGILAGIQLARRICSIYDAEIQFKALAMDGDSISKGTAVATLQGNARSLLAVERLLLNFMQRLSAIATQTREAVELVKAYPVKLLDTRKTTPGLRILEKWAVKTGGGYNHRIGLYDMIMLKDNHIDSAGGIEKAINRTRQYLQETGKNLAVEIETRNLEELKQVLAIGGVQRIMLDNFSPSDCETAVKMVGAAYETEASGGIHKENLLNYARTGVDFISLGYLTHSVKSLDISMKTRLYE